MSRILAAIAVLTAAALQSPAHAEPSARVDRLQGVDASLSRVDGDRTIHTYVTFLRSDPVAGTGNAEGSNHLGLCVSVSNRETELDVVGPDTSYDDRGCAHDVTPARADGVIEIDVTIPTTMYTTTYYFRSGHLDGTSPSSVHVRLTWNPAAGRDGLCNVGGGSFGVGPAGGGISWVTGGTSADVAGSVTSEQLGDGGSPSSGCYFSEAYVRAGT